MLYLICVFLLGAFIGIIAEILPLPVAMVGDLAACPFHGAAV